MIRMLRPSIRTRLLLWFGVLVAFLLVGFGATAYQLQKTAAMEEIDAELARRIELVGLAFRRADHPHPSREMRALHHRKEEFPPPGFGFPPTNPPPHLPEALHAPEGFPPLPPPRERPPRAPVTLSPAVSNLFATDSGCFFAVWEDGGARLARSPSLPESVAPPQPPAAGTTRRHRTRDHWREAYQLTEMRDCVLVGRDISTDLARLRNQAWGLAAAGGLVLLLGLGGGWLFVGVSLRPLRDIGATARRISDGNLSERIPASAMDRELSQLAEVLNTTFARLDAAFARQKQFTADAAHELRTPLAVILSETQTTLRRERGAEEYRDTIRACEESAQKMRRLCDSMLELARLDTGSDSGGKTPVDLARVARECIRQLSPLAEKQGVQIREDLQPAEIPGHPDQIGRVFINLIANALDHTPSGGAIQVSLSSKNGPVLASVSDTGEGIAPHDLPHIFDRFYRASPSRSRADGHAGIGLAICKAIVEAHGGKIHAESAPGKGATLTLRFPTPPPAG